MRPRPPLLTHEPLGAAAVAALRAAVAAPSRGAVVVFHGDVRASHRGRAVGSITYSAYAAMAETAIARLCDEVERGADDVAVSLTHRLGEIAAGETSVIIAAAAPHREAAFAAARLALERLKKEVPIWKREHYADGTSAWREEETLGPGAAA